MLPKLKRWRRQCLLLILALLLMTSLMTVTSFAATSMKLCSQQIVVAVSDSIGTGEAVGDDGATVTVKGKWSLIGGTKAQTTTIRIYKNTQSIGTVSFDYTIANGGSLTIAGASYTNGDYSKTLNTNEEYLELKLTSKASTSETTTLTLSNIKYKEASASSKVTFEYDEALGSIMVDGNHVDNSTIKDIPLAGAEVSALPYDGSTFLGWVYADTGMLCAINGKLMPTEDCRIKAVFVNDDSNAWFKVGTTHLFEDLNDACDEGNFIILANNGKLPAGDYTIPPEDTLLIPFDSANTLYTNKPAGDVSDGFDYIIGSTVEAYDYKKPTVYRKLIMENGANIIVNGAISLSAKHFVANGGKTNAGSPSGPCSFIEMNTGSNISVNNGGKLYVWGFIFGDGTVTANSGSIIYENMQINDFRGGGATTDVATSSVFPFSQYYLQNIEVPLTLYAGAIEKGYTSLYIRGVKSAEIPFIGTSGSMFVPQNGYIIKDYDETTDRLNVDIYGDLSISSMAMEVAGTDINTALMNLPITNNIKVHAHSGKVTTNQNMLLLPGAEIIIEENAEMIINEGINAYAMDKTTWTSANYVIGAGNNNILPLNYKAGSTATRTVDNLNDAKMVINGKLTAIGTIYTTENGADICSLPEKDSKENGSIDFSVYSFVNMNPELKLEQFSNNSTFVYLPLTMAKLHNADGSYLSTYNPVYDENENPTEETILPISGQYSYENGVWVEFKPGFYYDANGGMGEMSPSYYEKIYEGILEEPVTVSISDCGFEREGYNFAGWSDSKDGPVNPSYAPGTEISGIDEEKTLYAVWEKETPEDVVIYWVLRDGIPTGTDVAYGTVPTYEEIAYEEPDGCVKYIFDGWATSKDGEVLKEIPVATETVTYYAIYHKIDSGKDEHDYGTPTYVWGENNSEVTATKVCTKDASHTVTETVEAAYTETAATCVEPGLMIWTAEFDTEGFEAQTKTEEIAEDAANHQSWNKGEVTKAATCTEKGVKTFTCACGETKTEEIAVDAANHQSWNKGEVTKAATCTEKGEMTYTCDCGYSYKEDIDMIDHTEGQTVVENTVPATCTEPGSYDEVVYCTATDCGIELSRETKSIDIIDHTEGVVVIENTVAATCSAKGSYDNVVYCTVCKKELSRETVETPKDDSKHNFTTVVTPPTCEEKGYTTYTCQYDVAHSYQKDWVDELPHTEGEVVVEKNVAPTCTEDGSYDNVVYCTVCEAEVSRDTITVAASGHDYGEVTYTWSEDKSSVTATRVCANSDQHVESETVKTEYNVLADAECDVPGTGEYTAEFENEAFATQKETVVIPALVHEFEDIDGEEACIHCGVPAKMHPGKDHEFGNGVVTKEATCTETGLLVKTCTCGETKEEVIPATDHKLVEVEANDPTCTADGNVYHWHCENSCGLNFETKDAKEDEVIEDVVIKTEGHKLTHVPAVDATCTTDGNVEYWNCGACQKNFDAENDGNEVNNVITPATDHAYGEVTYTWSEDNTSVTAQRVCANDAAHVEDETVTATSIVTTPAECESDGVRTWNTAAFKNSAFVAQEKTETIPATGHSNAQVMNAVKPTCTEPGYTAGKYCPDCEDWIEGHEVIKAIGHDYVIVENITSCINCKELADEQPDQNTKNGLYWDADGMIRYYVADEPSYAGLVRDREGDFYYINNTKTAVRDCTYGVGTAKANDLLPAGKYTFGLDGQMIGITDNPEQEIKDGLVKDKDGEIRYYIGGEPVYAGLMQDEEGNYYYINGNKTAVRNCTYTIGETKTNGLLKAGTYKFGADGKLIVEPEKKNGLVKDEDGKIRFYEEGVAIYAGLVKDAEGNYYYINSSKTAVTDRTYGVGEAKANGLLPAGVYEFAPDGKMIITPDEPDQDTKSGIIKDEDGKIRYYVDGEAIYAGLVKDAEGNYYYINGSKTAVTDKWYGIFSNKMNGITDINQGVYYFDENGILTMDKAWDGTIAADSSISKLIDSTGVINVTTSVEFASVMNYLTKEGSTSIKEINIVNNIDLGNVAWVLDADSSIINDEVVINGNNNTLSNLNGELVPAECNISIKDLTTVN